MPTKTVMPDALLELGAEVPQPIGESVEEYLSKNPTIADALRTFQVAQEEYRRSLAALTAVRVVTTQSTNVD